MKSLDFPVDHMMHSCILDVVSEIRINNAVKASADVCKVYDFGVCEDCIYLVMKDYPCSLLVRENCILRAMI